MAALWLGKLIATLPSKFPSGKFLAAIDLGKLQLVEEQQNGNLAGKKFPKPAKRG